jgi:hypothetical protein
MFDLKIGEKLEAVMIKYFTAKIKEAETMTELGNAQLSVLQEASAAKHSTIPTDLGERGGGDDPIGDHK